MEVTAGSSAAAEGLRGAARCELGRVKLPAALAGTAFALQVAGAPPPAVARAYARVAERRPDVIAHQDTKRGRQELLRWQALCCPTLTRTQTKVYETILAHYNFERMDAFPGYERIAELSKCCRRTAIRAVLVLEATGFLSVERRFRIVDRWEGSYRHDRTNVYRFIDGAPVEASAHNGGTDDASLDAPIDEGADEPTAPSPPRPNAAPVPPRPTAPGTAPPGSPRPNAAPAPPRPTAPSTPPLTRPTGDPYWDIFETAFVLEHRAAYGKNSTPGSVRQDHLRDQASDMLNELASECVAWARQPERRLDVEHLRVAEDLARRLARAWIHSPGRDNRHRERGHPIGWMCCDLSRKLCDDAVDGWKRAQRRLLPKAGPAVRPGPTTPTPPDEAAIRNAENTAIMNLVRQGVDFDEALRLGRAEGDKTRAALALAAPSPTTPAAAEPREQLVEPAGRAPPK